MRQPRLTAVLLLLLTRITPSIPAEESMEHFIDQDQALGEAKELFRADALSMAGCANCSSQEMDYCISLDMIMDHCCCDYNLPERFQYMAHACYKSQIPGCKPTALDCEEFQRISICCCQPYLRSQYRYHAWNFSTRRIPNLMLCLILTIMSVGTR